MFIYVFPAFLFHGLDGLGIESRWGRNFPHRSRPAPGAHPASKTMVTESLPAVKRPGRGVDHPPASNAKVKETVELYLYSSSGPSWSVPGRTISLLLFHCTKLSKHFSLRFRIRATCPMHMNLASTNISFSKYCRL